MKDGEIPLSRARATFRLSKRFIDNQPYITIRNISSRDDSAYLFVTQPSEIHYPITSKSINLYCKSTIQIGRISANSDGVEMLIPYAEPVIVSTLIFNNQNIVPVQPVSLELKTSVSAPDFEEKSE